jgi:Flp pilus assembly protein TadD
MQSLRAGLRALLGPLCCAAALAAGLAPGPAAGEAPERPGEPLLGEPSEADRERFARHALENARALRREGRLELAEAAARRALGVAPEDPALRRELARILEERGLAQEAASERAAADAVDPPPPPLPEAALDPPGAAVLVVLVPPDPEVEPARRPRSWPGGVTAETLARRLAARLPQARVVHAAPETLAAARDWLAQQAPGAVLSLRVDRIYCGDTVKDGRFGMAWLRAAAERPQAQGTGVVWGRSLLVEPRPPEACRAEATARALEQVLALASVREALAAAAAGADKALAAAAAGADKALAAPGGAWSRASLRALFPGLGARIEAELAEGQERLSRGRLEDAVLAFRRAAEVDPEDPAVLAYLHEAEASLALSRELSEGRRGGDDPGVLDPRFTPAQREALAARLVEERRRRSDLLAALAVLEEDARLPSQSVLESLRPVGIRDAEAFGPSLARRRAGSETLARAAFAPDGSEIARYYFPPGSDLPVLREEDTDADGHPDRWLAYAGSLRSEIWEDARDLGRPDVRLVFADGERLLRVELDRDGDDRPERILRYEGGELVSEARDENGDGVLDVFERFGKDGRVLLREEDTDADGQIDIRSRFE